MSKAYLEVVDRFIRIQEIMIADDKEFRKNPKKTARIASLLVMASIYSDFPLDKQYNVYKAMKQTISEKVETFKALGDSVNDIAATLIFASEINKQLK